MDFEPFSGHIWWWGKCGRQFGSGETIQSFLLSPRAEDKQPVSPPLMLRRDALSSKSDPSAIDDAATLPKLERFPVQNGDCAHLTATAVLLGIKMDFIDQKWDAGTTIGRVDWGRSIKSASGFYLYMSLICGQREAATLQLWEIKVTYWVSSHLTWLNKAASVCQGE